MSVDQWRKNNRLDVDSFKENNILREDVRSSQYPHAEACFPTIFTSVAFANAVIERVTAHSDCRVQHIDLHTHTICLFHNGNNKRRTEKDRMHDRVCDGVFLKQTIPIDRANSRHAPSANAAEKLRGLPPKSS